MRLLITGANGFIGSHLCRRLKEIGAQFDILDRSKIRWPEGLSELSLRQYSAVIHLAFPKIRQSDRLPQIEQSTLRPLELLLERTVGTECLILFVSSQSALEGAQSLYGQLKWRCEELLKRSAARWTIIRPGLVVGPGSRGLFASLRELIRRFPIIPLVGDGRQSIQLISVDHLVEAIIRVVSKPELFSGATLCVSGEPVPFRSVLQEIADELGVRRWFLPIPVSFVSGTLALLELILPDPPVTRSNLFGLLNVQLMETRSSMERLGLRTTEGG